MNSKIFLVLLIITAILLFISNLTLILMHPIRTIINIILIIAIVTFAILCDKQKKKEKYNYDLENPNALKYGQVVAGTVYADNPNEDPGLGWVL